MHSTPAYPPERADGGCPPPEELAAFAEGSASTKLRLRLVPHLARCEECAAVVAESARFLDGGEGAATVRRRPFWTLPLAAAIPVALTIAWAFASRPADREQTAESAAVRPAWLTDAPWNSGRRARLGFAPSGAQASAILLGLHLGALDRACLLAAGPRELAAREVERSLLAGGLLDEAHARGETDRAARGECEHPPGALAATDPRVELGRSLETWRIAIAGKEPGALDPRRAREALDLVRAVGLPPAAARLAEKLLAEAQARPARWDEMQADLLDLIEMLCR